MAHIKDAIYTLLTGSQAITDIVGDRIFPMDADENQPRPLLLYQLDTMERQYQITTGKTEGSVNARFTITMITEIATQLSGLSEAVRFALQGYTGTSEGVFINPIELDDEVDRAIPPYDDGGQILYTTEQRYIVPHIEAVPDHGT